MKNYYLLFIALIGLALWSCGQPAPRVIERPDYGLQNSQTLEIGKVELTDTATILHIDAYFTPNYWIRIDPETYIQANGKKYTITGSKDIVLDEYHWMPESGEDHFVLYFPPLPKGTKSFDFIESDCDDCFKIWDIDLTGKSKQYKSDIPKELIDFRIDKSAALEEPEFKMGKTDLKLFLHGWKEGYALSPILMVGNLFTREYEEVEGKLVKDGEYLFECDLYSTANCFLRLGHSFVPLLLAPGESAEVHYDLEAQSRRISRYHPQPTLKHVAFRGKYAQVNTESSMDSQAIEKLYINLYEEYSLLDLTAGQYASRLISLYKEYTHALEKADISKGLRQILKENFKTTIVDHVMMAEYYLESLYRRKNNLRYDEPIDYKAPTLTDKDFLVLKELNLNDRMWMYSGSFLYSGTGFASRVASDELLNEITGTTSGLLQDIRKSAPAMALTGSREELKPEIRTALQSTSIPYYTEVYEALTQKSKQQYEKALAQGGFDMLATPDVSHDKILETIVSQYKGNAIFVDFWATWCGPCVNAMKTIKPLKPEMAEKGVVSVYISNASSPQAKWVGMLPEIGGLHYYLTNEEWEVVSNKYQIRGIPTYMIFDKKGKKTFETSGYPGNDKIREELEKVW